MKKYLPLFLLLLGSSFLSLAVPQFSDGFIARLKQKLEEFNSQMPREKVYLHIDKPFYKPGDAIWFQAYLVEGQQHRPSEISNVIYVELINPKGNVAEKLTLSALEGRAMGDFQLAPTAAGGLYKVRAYTRWMQNFGEDTFFSKELQVQKIVSPKLLLTLDFERDAYGPGDQVVATLKARDLKDNPVAEEAISFHVSLAGQQVLAEKSRTNIQGEAFIRFSLPDSLATSDGLLNVLVENRGVQETISRAVPIVLNKISLQFFPEGGDLVQNVSGRVAFKALNEFGKAADVEGIIVDEEGNEVQRFSSFHKGMGAFNFIPEEGKTYLARLTKPVATDTTYPLPKPLPNGYVLNIKQQNPESLTASVYSPLNKPLYLIGQLRGGMYFSRKIMAEKGINKIEIPLDSFPIGVAQFTLFDHQQLERCERLVFVNRERKLQVEIETDREYYQAREKVTVKLRTYDEHQLPVPASLSLSVVDDKIISYADDKQDNILSHLLLSSDLKGKVEEPSYYFDPAEAAADEALDYLLMTQGWRRFKWQQLMVEEHTFNHYPEKLGSISGRLINRKTGKPVEGEVTLVELDNRRRAAQLKTKPDGSFLFLKTDPGSDIQLFAKARLGRNENLQLVLDQEVEGNYEKLSEPGMYQGEEIFLFREIVEVPDEEVIEEELELNMDVSQSIVLEEDVKQLQEVVIVGYDPMTKSNISEAVTVVNQEFAFHPGQSLEQALQGRVAGVEITPNSATPGASARISIRGSSSIASGDPLFVVDGFPIETNGRSGLSALGFLSADDIKSVSVLKGPEASALYGSRASNGVVLINTKSGHYYPHYNRRLLDNYTSLYIKPTKFSPQREFYMPDYSAEEAPGERTDFRETIYWNPGILTDHRGEASISFYTSDATTAFRITAEGIGVNGLPGWQEHVFSTRLPVSVEATIPPYFSFEDRFELPVQLKNNTDKPLKGKLQVEVDEVLKGAGSWEPEIEIAPNSSKTVYYQGQVKNKAGTFEIFLSFEGEGFKDQVRQMVEVLPKGFPVEVSFSGKDLQQTFSFSVTDPVPGSLSAGFTAYPNVLGDLLSGISSILRQPHGCFEQVSSSTYPNVLALQFMEETRQDDPAVRKKALGLIADGYKQLAAYETREHGFEWYGDTPPHEGLSAFGLLELTEMKKVYGGVSEALLKRTKDWLLNRRDDKGGFKQNRGKYGFAAASKEVNNAYIVYALAATEVPVSIIEKEYLQAYQEVLKSGDAYRMALLANASFYLQKEDEGKVLLTKLRKQLQDQGLGKLQADHSLVRRYGNSLQIETAALVALAMLQEERPNVMEVQGIINYLLSRRSFGSFGSTQGTVMALTALTEWAKFSQRTAEGGLISLRLNKHPLASQRYEKDHHGEILLASLESGMQEGRQDMEVIFDDTKEALPYSFYAQWTSYTPASSKECRVALRTNLSSTEIKVQETVRLSIELKNETAEGIPQTLAVVGIPSGLSLQAWQLKDLQEKGLFDFYEIQGNFVVFYYREMAPNDKRTINLDLKASVPGIYQASASSAYLYYTNEYKYWVEGERIKILQ
ncbi:TonB-dependent receptor plug domain-containing protein [Nafulsella turpanensis]|uniref:TonB-dependent receptor plug domain-containing protein n=1 Tax=Nafulsella turpanensis TaxID=1265690 RepID=UPI0003491DDD|nr:TonB-dependent receptor plug domain-containing protein [Nafulsella turpanensis]